MNILFLSCENIAGNYGIGTYANAMFGELSNRDGVNVIDIEIFCTRQAELSIVKTGNLTRICIPKPAMTGSLTGIKERDKIIYAKKSVELIREHVQELPDAVIHLNYHVAIFLAQHLRDTFGYPIVYVTHVLYWKVMLGMRPDLQQKALLAKTKADHDEMHRHFRSKSEELTFLTSERSIFVTRYAKNNLGALYHIPENRKRLVYNGISINTSHESNNLDRRVLKKEMGFNEDTPLVLFCGRLDAGKGIYHLINSFRTLIKRQPEARLVLVGSGEYDIVLKALNGIAPYVTITGFIPKEEVYNYYKIADVGVIPSLHEQCSYVAIEMMLHGLPIVASSIDGLSEMFENGSTALMVDTYTDESAGIRLDENMLADCIHQLLTNRPFAAMMCRNAKDYAEREFSSSSMVTNTISIYKEALAVARGEME